MTKAFDRVNHELLINKLRHFGFKNNLINWFQSYLFHRRQQVTVLGSTSSSLPVISDVPQGSILGPVLFLLHVNDLPDAVSSSTVATFADNTKLFKTIACKADSLKLQEALNTLTQWSTSTNHAFNPTKWKVETISHKRIKLVKTCYMMGDLEIEHCSHERDLGGWISTDLTWKKQVQTQSAKANKSFGYGKRSTQCIKSIGAKRTIYLTIVHILHMHRQSGPLKL